jgi:hypothetical protein
MYEMTPLLLPLADGEMFLVVCHRTVAATYKIHALRHTLNALRHTLVPQPVSD